MVSRPFSCVTTPMLTKPTRAMDPAKQPQEGSQEAQDELMNLMTIMYITIQEVLSDRKDMATVQTKLRAYVSMDSRGHLH